MLYAANGSLVGLCCLAEKVVSTGGPVLLSQSPVCPCVGFGTYAGTDKYGCLNHYLRKECVLVILVYLMVWSSLKVLTNVIRFYVFHYFFMVMNLPFSQAELSRGELRLILYIIIV